MTVTLDLDFSSIASFLFQLAFRPLEKLAYEMVDLAKPDENAKVDFIKTVTKPLTKLLVEVNTKVINQVIEKELDCESPDVPQKNCTILKPETDSDAVLNNLDLGDKWSGIILLIVSLLILCGSLLLMVKTLNSLLKGTIARAVKRVLNPTFESPVANYFYGYVNIIVGTGLTVLVQSSSVFTSTLTPLVGIGLLTVETVYPLFIGSNIGTTVTGLLAALASTGNFEDSMAIALVHLLFNLSGLLLFYPIPFMRIPIPLCKVLGKTTANYRWFAVVYLILMFVLVPGIVIAASFNEVALIIILVVTLGPLAIVTVINVIQNRPQLAKYLPEVLRNWDYLPLWMRSLDPIDE